jgi:hypothetical protein
MVVYILVGLGIVLIAFLVLVALQPADFRIVRTRVMAAPAAEVFGQVNDFHQWQAWSPWAKLDPSMKQTYEGAPAGTGAVYMWTGNKQVGEGRMTVLESRPSELIRIKLEFLRPFKATNTAEFAFEPNGHQTAVAWSMSGRKNFLFKAFGLFMNLDKMIGSDFEKGLANMKAVVETPKQPEKV